MLIDIPLELLLEILLRLQLKDLFRCMYVSKAWNAFFSSQRFVKAHLAASTKINCSRVIIFQGRPRKTLRRALHKPRRRSLSSIPFYADDTFETAAAKIRPPLHARRHIEILGHCNGLVCLYSVVDDDQSEFAVWNPSIHRFKKIPSPTFEQPQSSELDACPFYGFGYDSANHDYKLVAIAEFWDEYCFAEACQVKLYSLNSNSWKTIDYMPYSGFQSDSTGMVFLNGTLSWLIYENFSEIRYIILTLDLATEKYHEFSLPLELCGNGTSQDVELEILGGSLCIVHYNEGQQNVWIMKEYGVAESWTLICSIDSQAIRSDVHPANVLCKPLVFSKDGDMILLTSNDDALFWYDLKSKSIVKGSKIRGIFENHTICCGSLCLLDGDPVIDRRKHKVPSTFKRRKFSSIASGAVEAADS